MNKITSIHLNGKAYQLEEAGFVALEAYLRQAEHQLMDNPDKQEIMADLEQAIGEKANAFLQPGRKDVVTSSEIEQILKEMGPVDGAGGDSTSQEKTNNSHTTGSSKRLYLIREGAIIGGVCTGLAAYFDLDVAIVRLIFAGLTILTGGGWILLYLAFLLFVPYANTSEQRAAAHGEPFSAQEVINRAKESYARFTDKQGWRRWRQEFQKHAPDWGRTPGPRAASSFFGVLIFLLAVVWLIALISFITKGFLFLILLPFHLPVWVVILGLFLIYHIATGPMKAIHAYPGATPYHNGWTGAADGLSAVFLLIASLFLYVHYPQVQAAVAQIPEYLHRAMNAIRQTWN